MAYDIVSCFSGQVNKKPKAGQVNNYITGDLIICISLSNSPFSLQDVFLSAKKATDAALEMLDKLFDEISDQSQILGIGVAVSGFFTNTQGQICITGITHNP